MDGPIEQASQKSKGLRTETTASVKLSEGTKLPRGGGAQSHPKSPDKPALPLGVEWPDQRPFLVAEHGPAALCAATVTSVVGIWGRDGLSTPPRAGEGEGCEEAAGFAENLGDGSSDLKPPQKPD